MGITREKDLWSGRPVWFSYRSPRIPSSPLCKNLRADIIVVGAGVSGATMAEELTDDGFSVILLDHRKPGYGSTSASTALLQYDLDQPLIKLSRQIGAENAARAWRRSRLGLENLAAKTRALNIQCDFERHDALYLSGNILNARALLKECEARRSIGLHTEYLDRKILKESYGIKRDAALCVRDNISVNPRRFVAGYLAAAIEKGARLFSPASVTDIQTHRDHVILNTEQGYEIRGRYVVFATGYEIFKGIKLKHKHVASSWAFATRPQPRNLWPGHVHIWEASDPYLYIRVTKDGRVVCGGEDEEFSDEAARDALIPQKTRTLQKKLKKLFPHLDAEAEFAWAGCFGETKTGLPMIGAVPGMKNCFAVLAFGGNGITFSRIAAEIIATTLRGKQDPDADLFLIR